MGKLIRRVGMRCTLCGFYWTPAKGYPDSLWRIIDDTGILPPTWAHLCTNCDVETAHFLEYETAIIAALEPKPILEPGE